MENLHGDLRGTLDELRDELERVERVDPDVQRLLETAVQEIREVLDTTTKGTDVPATKGPNTIASPDAAAVDDESLVGRLGEAARHFEESHPTLSGILGSMIDALGRMGI